MATKRGNSARKASGKKSSASSPHGKVGSDRAADKEFGGKLDFGIPAARAKSPQPIGGRDKGPEQGTGPMRSGSQGTRTSGVGHAPGKPGTGSGGDLDPSFIGLDRMGGIAAAPASGRTEGADITAGGSSAFASGPPAKGENQTQRGAHGAVHEKQRGSTVDRTGGDASTTGWGGGSDSTAGAPQSNNIDDAAAGEITSDEAGGE